MKHWVVQIALFAVANAACACAANADDKVDFNRDIQPLLADRCFACHGRDAQQVQGELRLDLPASATKKNEEGRTAIVPGKPDASELVRRIFSNDESEIMPPAETNKPLQPAERELLKRWVAQGAEYQQHWAFVKPVRRALPKVADANWPQNDIDRFVLARLESNGLKPSAEASRTTLIRRVSLDLRGFPPTIAEVEQFLNDSSPSAYEQMVDRMLASQHFGEKMALIWMDLGRYGDTNGYHYDSTRQVWLWRDWVINAYNKNMPFDQFTIEQLAGDLLPDATLDQKIASGFNRNTRYNEEGGADPAEWLVRYAIDRTNTLGQVWLGMTVNCAECHSHKYDPISQKEFYQLYAFFNSMNEPGAQGHNQQYPPLLKVPQAADDKKLTAAKTQIAAIEVQIKQKLAAFNYAEPEGAPKTAEPAGPTEIVWVDDELPTGAKPEGNGLVWVVAPNPVHSSKRSMKRVSRGNQQHFFTSATQKLKVGKGDKLFAWVYLDPANPPKEVMIQFNSAGAQAGWKHRAYWGKNLVGYGRDKTTERRPMGPLPSLGKWIKLEVDAAHIGLTPGMTIHGMAFTQFDGTAYWDTAGIVTSAPQGDRHLRSLLAWVVTAKDDKNVPEAVRKLIQIAHGKRSAEQQRSIQDHFVEHVFTDSQKLFSPLHKQIAAARKQIEQIEKSVPFQLVSVEMPNRRQANILMRGDFQKRGEAVEPDVPAIFHRLPTDQPRNRLGLAHWLTDPQHPLTARVTVNRFWAQLFGRGIVETVGDFGHLGRYPSHPELLDWLATGFVESGWDTKSIMKAMVMSATYQQSSVNDGRHAQADRNNTLLWRAPRFRLSAEEIRDTSLQIAGMLSPKIGGPPVFPYQPPDYYKGKKGGWRWDLSKGEDRYRRGMYTFWRRTTPYPTFVIFDAPDRSECVVARSRTNTPLQALVTLNDPQFVEAARVFGQRIMTEGPAELDGRLTFAFQLAVARKPSSDELTVLRDTYQEQLDHYKANAAAAKSLVKAGEYARPEKLNVTVHAAWTAIANTLLNLDETISRE